MAEGASHHEGLKLQRDIVERHHQLPGFEIQIAGSADIDHIISRKKHPDNYGDFGQDGYVLGGDGNSFFVFDGISTYQESYPFGLAITQQLAEERSMVLDYIDDDSQLAVIKFMLEGAISQAIKEKQGGVVFSGFIRLSDTKILVVKTGDCPIILRKKDGTVREVLPPTNESLKTSGLDFTMLPKNYDLQLSIIDIEAGDKVIIASDGILSKSARDGGLEALKRYGNDASPKEIVHQVVESTPIRNDQDDVIVAEVTFIDGANKALLEAA